MGKYVRGIYALILAFLAASVFSVFFFPKAVFVFYVLAVSVIPMYAAHFCSGFILSSMGEVHEDSRLANFALIHPVFLKIIYCGVCDDRVDRQVVILCRNCHLLGVLGTISIVAFGVLSN